MSGIESTHSKFDIEKFDGKGDFGMWKCKMLMQLELQELEPVLVEEGKEDPDSDAEVIERGSTKWRKMDKRARNLICTSLGNRVLRKVMKETTALGVWKALESDYQQKSLPNRIYLKQKFASFKMNEHKGIEENVDDFLKLISDLSSLDINISDEDQAIQILSSLPKQFDSLVDTLKYGNKKETLTIEDVVNAAYSKETELREKGLLGKGKVSGEGLYVENRGRSAKRENKNGSKQWNRKSKGRSSSRGRSVSKSGCFVCGKEGHWKRECPERKKGNNSANVVAEPRQPIALTVSVHDSKDEWVMDSGCSFHMTPNRSVLFDFKEFNGNKVLMANNSQCEVKGIGKIRIENADGTVVTLNEVRYMPSLGRNLISYGMLEKSGCNYEGKDYRVIFYKDGQEVLSGKYKEGLYFLEGKVSGGEANITKAEVDKTAIWHSRLGHMSLKNMNILVKEGYLPRKDVDKLDFCEDCVLGKSHKQSFPKAKHTTNGILEYIHSDLWGSPSTPESLGGCRYFISFIDDYSKKVWVYFLSSKDEAFSKFRDWKEAAENLTGKKIKFLRTDNGLEFCNKQFDGLCKESGITRHKTCTYTPQQNGVAERMNRTLMDKVRCMLAESGLGEEFWAEATSTAAYITNRSPNSSIDYKLPEEVWSGTKPSLEHLRRFGCPAYVHTTQGKTEPRAVKGFFVGYPFGVKGYRVWLPEELIVTTSRNVVFNEAEVYKNTIKLESDSELEKSEGKTRRVTFKQGLIQGPTPSPTPIEDSEIEGGAVGGDSDENQDSVQGGEPSELVEEESDSSNNEEQSGSEEELDLDEYVLSRDRIRRQIKKPSRYDEDGDFVAYALSTAEEQDIDEPKCFQEAMRSSKSKFWKGATDEEMDSLGKNQTYVLIDKPKNAKPIGCKWVFKLKPGIPGIEDQRFKARLVAKGYSQKEGVDYNEIFAPVVKHVSIRGILSIVVNLDFELEQMDVKTAFLHGELEERILMNQPEGYIRKGDENKVCLLKKSLYGLKQSPRQWNMKFDNFMKDQKFQRSMLDSCVYMRNVETGKAIYLLLYVDDILIASGNKEEIKQVKEKLSSEFEMKDLGAASRILGMDIVRDRKKGTLILSQQHYLEKVLKNFGMAESKAVVTPVATHHRLKSLTEEEKIEESRLMDGIPYASAVGSLMYGMIGTRPDLGFAVGLISRFMANPGRPHWDAVKWVLRYLKGATARSLRFEKSNSEFDIEGFCDSDYATDIDKRRSVTGYVFKVWGNTVCWKSGLQSVVALSTTEAEYMALTAAVKEAIWLKNLFDELGFNNKTVTIHCDSQSALALAKNAVYHERTKHMATKFHFIRDIVSKGSVRLSKIHTSKNPADFLTKALPGPKFDLCCDLVNIA